MAIWTLHGDGKRVGPGEVVAPHERLSWPRTIGIGAQHVVAMAGATLLVPAITGFPATTTLFFSGIGTILFLLITRNRVPSYLGSSFAFIAPITAAMQSENGMAAALGGVLVTGALLAAVGVVVQLAGVKWIDIVMPPIVTGAVVALIGFNLAPAAWDGVQEGPITAVATISAILVFAVLFRGILGRLSILLGVVTGYLVAVVRGEVDFAPVGEADLFGFPEFTTPVFEPQLLALFIPVVLVLIAENVGHVKTVAAMTGENLDASMGRALIADGVATTLAGAGGGSGTTTYAENIGVMAANRVYSTAAYVVAAAAALLLSLSPKVGAIIATIPGGVLGGAGTVLYGMIAVLGARIWLQNKVDFSDPVNLMTAGAALIVAAANYSFSWGDLLFEGIAIGTATALVGYHVMRGIQRWRGTGAEPASPASVPAPNEITPAQPGD